MQVVLFLLFLLGLALAQRVPNTNFDFSNTQNIYRADGSLQRPTNIVDAPHQDTQEEREAELRRQQEQYLLILQQQESLKNIQIAAGTNKLGTVKLGYKSEGNWAGSYPLGPAPSPRGGGATPLENVNTQPKTHSPVDVPGAIPGAVQDFQHPQV